MRFAEEDVRAAEDRLRGISRRVQEFRIENEIIDPTAIAETQMGVISELQSRLADVLVERETLLGFADPEDQRVKELDRQIEAIRGQIKGERRRMGGAAAGPGSLAQSIGDYEELLVEKEFAQNAYQSALAAQEQARAEAQRITRYLAVHIPPTRAEESRYPQRPLLTLLVMVCSFAAWATAVLIYYNVRDRS
jgi:capsular polysaccharide transport system permease protein